MKKEKISKAIGNIDEKYVEEAGMFEGKKRKIFSSNKTKWLAMAAGVVLIAGIAIGAFQTGLIGGSSHKAKLEDGSVISFAKGKQMSNRDIAVSSFRQLSDKEIGTLFGGIEADVIGYLDEDDEIMGLVGHVDDMKLIVSANGGNLNDTVIDGKEEVSYVNGVPVVAGYFVTDASSKGERTIIYYATLEFGDNKVYLEHSGPYSERNRVRKEIADKIEDFAELGEINLEYLISIDNMTFDIDDDGIQEECLIGYGRTSGVFTFSLSVYENGKMEYFNIFNTKFYYLSFVEGNDGKICIQGISQDVNADSCYFDIKINGSNIELYTDGKQVNYWGEQGVDSKDKPQYIVVPEM